MQFNFANRYTTLLFITFIMLSALSIHVFANDEENGVTMKTIRLLKTMKVPHKMTGAEPNGFSFMNSGRNNECFLHNEMRYYYQDNSNNTNFSDIQIYSILDNSLHLHHLMGGSREKMAEIDQIRQQDSKFLERATYTMTRFDNIMAVSPSGLILFRFSPFTSELHRFVFRGARQLYDDKDNDVMGTNRRLGDNEMIIGFGPDLNLYGPDSDFYKAYGPECNIYCYRPTPDSMFLLRNAVTGEVLKTYNTELLADVLSWKADNRLNYQPYYVPQTTSDGCYTMFYLISNESGNRGIVVVCDNKKNCVVAKNSVSLDWPYPLCPIIRDDNRFIAVPNNNTAVKVYDFENQRFHNCHVSLPQSSAGRDSRTTREMEMRVRGFSFTPDNKLVMWKTTSGDHGYSEEYFQPWEFDLETYERSPLVDFVTPGIYTRFFWFNVQHGIAITFETNPDPPIHPADRNELLRANKNNCIGKYVFWDFNIKERIFETEEKYHPNIIVSPDGNQVYLTSKERCYEFYQTGTMMLDFVDVFEIQ